MRISNLFKLSYWFDPTVLDQRAGGLMWLVVIAGLVWAAAGVFVFLRRTAATKSIPRDVAIAQFAAGLIAGAVAVGRLFAIAPLGLRAGWLIAGLVAIGPFIPRVIWSALRDGVIGDAIAAMVFIRPSNRYAINASRTQALHDSGDANILQTLGVRRALRQPAWRFTTALLWLVVHGFCSMLLMAVLHLPLWYGPALAGLILLPHLLSLVAQTIVHKHNLQSLFANLNLTALAPLFVVYLVTALRIIVALSVQAVTGEARVIEPWSSILNLLLWVIVMGVYALAISFYHAVQHAVKSDQAARHPIVNQVLDRRFVKIAAAALVCGIVAWASWNALTLHTQGVTGSDPYAYTQMGVDLAQHGTVFHQFPLIRLTYELNIPSEPVIHIGYRLPQDVQRIATTVWPPGYAVFTALGYLLAGEQGLYLVTPLLSLLSLAVIWGLTHALLAAPSVRAERTLPRSDPAPAIGEERNGVRSLRAMSESIPLSVRAYSFPIVVAAITVALTATSYQQVEWQLIPMADIAAQLFSLLAVALAFRVARPGPVPSVAQRLMGAVRGAHIRQLSIAVLCGFALGIAFDVRYTQVLIAPALLFALLSGSAATDTSEHAHDHFGRRLIEWLRRHGATLVAFGVGALLAALPVLVYHASAFGSPFSTGSEELSNFSLARLPETLARITSELASPREFGMLLPLIVIGLAEMWRGERRATLTLVFYFVPLFVLHIAYAYLRPRDILSLFPVLSLLVAYGAVWLVMSLRNISARALKQSPSGRTSSSIMQHLARLLPAIASAIVLVVLSFVLVLRSIDTLALPVTHGFDAFGYLVREQRASFTRLGELTPANAAIGCSLNSGAVDLYAGRLTFRPGRWTADDAMKFVRALRGENTPVYILEDGAEVTPVVESLRAEFTLVEVARLDMPFYFKGSGSENRQAALYRVEQ